MSSQFKRVAALRGMNDVLPDVSAQWEMLETIVRDWLQQYGYRNMRTPLVELTRLFTRSIGEVTDIVEKEMYTFDGKGNDEASLTLRPEMTAGLVRAAIEHSLLYERPQRVYALGPVFRHERPQSGRYRQFHQIDVEAMGFAGPDVDAEMIVMLARLWRALGLTGMRLELNSLGQPEARATHRTKLVEYLEAHRAILDEESQRRMYSNPLRVLDTKNPAMQAMANHAPRLLDFLDQEARAHFEGLCARLDDAGIAYNVNPRLVRGLDYYNLTVFEWVTDRIGAQGTVCGGGRYDGLFEMLGGKPTPAIGFGIGFERLLDLWQQAVPFTAPPECDVYIVHQGEAAQRLAAIVGEQLRAAGLAVIVHAGTASFKAQFKRADASGALHAVILGPDEVANKSASIKPLRAGPDNADQRTIPLTQLAEALKSVN
jgi:histidyl-tRNA synthetase